MHESIRQLEPTGIWNHFCDLNAVPRPSKKEEKVIAFIKQFGEKLNLPTIVDEVGNVIIKKKATTGMEQKATIVLQSHLDMVHQKNAATIFDFNTQGIEMIIDGDWIRANGTTLGADNGIGVATIMTLLASTDIQHPALEALFTIDEETGMTGALALKGGLLDGEIMLNLDTEEDDELTIGCAGGIDVTANGGYELVKSNHNVGMKISIQGLTGGHSGIDIHKGRANANKIMNRLLMNLNAQFGIEINHIDGGSLRNAIPRESFGIFAIQENVIIACEKFIDEFNAIIQKEYHTTDPNLNISMESTLCPEMVINNSFQTTLLACLYACPNGIYRMSPDIEGLVQTSNNLSRVHIANGKYSIQCLTRSSVDSEKIDLRDAITSVFNLLKADVSYGGSYPGWAPNPSSPIVTLMRDLYIEKFESEPKVAACHAGLECGILGTNYPKMQMISFGPTIHGAHSPDEKVSIASVQKYWGFLLETLKRMPIKTA
jgi:dipeptidase D